MTIRDGRLPAAGGPARLLAFQIARFGELAGRDLAAMARARRGAAARDGQPLTAAEQLEMAALRAAIAGDHGPALAATAGAARPGPGTPASIRAGRPGAPARLRRRPSAAPGRAAGRHHRLTGASLGAAAGSRVTLA